MISSEGEAKASPLFWRARMESVAGQVDAEHVPLSRRERLAFA